ASRESYHFVKPFSSSSRWPSGLTRKRRNAPAACWFLLLFTTPPDWRIGLCRVAGSRIPPRWLTNDHAVMAASAFPLSAYSRACRTLSPYTTLPVSLLHKPDFPSACFAAAP